MEKTKAELEKARAKALDLIAKIHVIEENRTLTEEQMARALDGLYRHDVSEIGAILYNAAFNVRRKPRL